MGKWIRDKSEEKMLKNKISNEINKRTSTFFDVSKNVDITLKIFLVAQISYYVYETYRDLCVFIHIHIFICSVYV